MIISLSNFLIIPCRPHEKDNSRRRFLQKTKSQAIFDGMYVVCTIEARPYLTWPWRIHKMLNFDVVITQQCPETFLRIFEI